MILATDLDRTLLPNGHDPYDGTLPLLMKVISQNSIPLIYVTGRNLDEFNVAREEYGISYPHYLVSEVGTVIYRFEDSVAHRVESWDRIIEKYDPSWDREKIISALSPLTHLELQEDNHQNRFKISLYSKAGKESESDTHQKIREVLQSLGLHAQITESFDPLKNVGLVDILPREVNKSSALKFLFEEIGEGGEIIYCGDSGNDIAPLASESFYGVVVKNAPEDVKRVVREVREESGSGDRLYIAEGSVFNGNYSSGILEGLVHFGFVSKNQLQGVDM